MHDFLDDNAALPGLISQKPSDRCLMKLSLLWAGLNEQAISVIRHLYAIKQRTSVAVKDSHRKFLFKQVLNKDAP